jgi:hypothetical protein
MMSADSEPLTSGPPAVKDQAGLIRAGGLLAVAVGFGLRVYLLDRQGLWYDEAFNLSVARSGWPELLGRAAADFYPPLYHLILWVWTDLVGTGEFAVRYPSVWFGTLVVPAVFAFGAVTRGLLPAEKGGRVCLLPAAGALLAAFSPLIVDLSQEARMYTLLALGMVLAEAAWARLVSGSGFRDGALYLGAMTAALYTHYAALLGWVFQPWQVLFAKHDRRLRLLLVWAAPVLLFAPWWGVAWGRFSGTVNPGAGTSLPEILRRSIEIFWTGYGVEPFFPAPDPATAAGDTLKATALGGAITAAFLYGLLATQGPRRYLVPLVGPLLLWYPVALGRRDFAPQYVIWVAALGWVFVALSILRLPRFLAAGALGLTLGAEVFALFNLHYVPRYWNDDFRGVARLIEGLSRPGEAIIVNAHYATVALNYYYRGQAPRFGLPDRPDQPDASLEAELRQIARSHPFVWVVLWQAYYSDPQDRVRRWLSATGYLGEDWDLRPHAKVVGFWTAPPVLDALPPEALPGPAAALGDSIRLAGLVPPRPVLEPAELASGRPELHYILYWEVVRPVDEAYNVFVHVLDPAGRVVLQGDGPPVRGSFPTDRWPAAKIIRDDRMLRLPPDFRSGEYRLLIGMYRLSDLVRLGHGGVDRVEVGPFKMGP